jgi:hypothetical protein
MLDSSNQGQHTVTLLDAATGLYTPGFATSKVILS